MLIQNSRKKSKVIMRCDIEHQHMARLSMKHKIISDFRYVDNILMIFDLNHSSIQTILADFNTLHPNLQFTAEMEENNTIKYLYVTIRRTPTIWKTAIYRKPTFTDTIIPYTSNHPLATQIRSSQVPLQQATHIRPTTR